MVCAIGFKSSNRSVIPCCEIERHWDITTGFIRDYLYGISGKPDGIVLHGVATTSIVR